MANNKTGLAYYNTDTDRYQDIRIKRLKKDFGCAGIAVYDYLLCEVYRVSGCSLVWDESRAFDVADYFNIKESLVKEIVEYCGTVGLFDKAVLTSGIITSLSIQNRYKEMCIRAKRKNIIIPQCCEIIPVQSPKLPVQSTQNTGSLPQSKVKKSKVNESKVNESKELEQAEPTHSPNSLEIDFKRFEQWILDNTPSIAKMKEPFTREQFDKIKAIHGHEAITELLGQMHNWKPLLIKNQSAYLTFTKWAKQDKITNKTNYGTKNNDPTNHGADGCSLPSDGSIYTTTIR